MTPETWSTFTILFTKHLQSILLNHSHLHNSYKTLYSAVLSVVCPCILFNYIIIDNREVLSSEFLAILSLCIDNRMIPKSIQYHTNFMYVLCTTLLAIEMGNHLALVFIDNYFFNYNFMYIVSIQIFVYVMLYIIFISVTNCFTYIWINVHSHSLCKLVLFLFVRLHFHPSFYQLCILNRKITAG